MVVKDMLKKVKKSDFEEKREEFFKWYEKVYSAGFSSKKIKLNKEQLSEFIKKMAIWYELRYSVDEVMKDIYNAGYYKNVVIEDLKFKDNEYINKKIDDLGENYDKESVFSFVSNLKWSEFYNFDVFFDSLSSEEKLIFDFSRYPNYISFKVNGVDVEAYITKEGYMYKEDMKNKILKLNGVEFKEIRLDDFLDEVSKYPSILISNKDKEKICEFINLYDIKCEFRERILNCVMYEIIRRGGETIGLGRGLLFAREFGRDLSVPMKYAVNFSNVGYLKNILDKYFLYGGNRDINCYVDYFSFPSKSNVIALNDLEKMLDDGSIYRLFRKK